MRERPEILVPLAYQGLRLLASKVTNMSKNIHITHRADRSWAVVQAASDWAMGLYPTQEQAINVGRPIAKINQAELVIHDRKNRIRDKDSYGNDPPYIRDTRF